LYHVANVVATRLFSLMLSFAFFLRFVIK